MPLLMKHHSVMYHLIVLFLVVFYCCCRWRNLSIYRQLRNLPGPWSLPLLGSGHLFVGKSSSEVFRIFGQLSAKYGAGGSPVRLYLGTVPTVIVHQPEHAQAILCSHACLEKPWLYRFNPVEGLFSLPVEKWRAHRKLIQPSFSLVVLKSYIPIFRSKVDSLLGRLDREAAEGKLFDAYGYVAACTLDMIYATTIGMDMRIQEQKQCKYLDVLEEPFELTTKRIANVLLHPQWIYRKTSCYRKESQARKVFCSPAQVILKRRPLLMDSTSRIENSSKPRIFIDQLYEIARRNPSSDRVVIEKELNGIIFVGHETTATTLANALLLIAMHPPVQDKLVEEIFLLLESIQEQELSISHLQQLSYMDAVLKEAMRLLPITTILGRTTTTDFKMDNIVIPAGVNLAIDVFTIHRSQQHWGPDADLFVPERFLNGRHHHPYAFLGFSAGSRNCIGGRFAWISMKIMLVGILQRFELATPLRLEDIRFKIALSLKVMNKHMISLKRR